MAATTFAEVVEGSQVGHNHSGQPNANTGICLRQPLPPPQPWLWTSVTRSGGGEDAAWPHLTSRANKP
jgi:hypothetical protein